MQKINTSQGISSIDLIRISDFDYELPAEKIAPFPLPERDQSKLLVLQDNQLSETIFSKLPDILINGSFLIFNNTRVVHARLRFRKPTGAFIEIFCLEPADKNVDMQLALQQKGSVSWKCFVGNNKRWDGSKLQLRLHSNNVKMLTAERKEAIGEAWIIDFNWTDAKMTFAEVLESMGEIPLPPYLQRKAEVEDKQRYQTIYAFEKGSVAAPTAGLHFTPEVFEKLVREKIDTDYVTLHVGAGTFKPVSSESIAEHEMHAEQVMVTKSFLENLLKHIGCPVIAVGTTSARTIESLYWYGVKLLRGRGGELLQFDIRQWDAYDGNLNEGDDISSKMALQAILTEMGKTGKTVLTGETRLMIVPGYRFRIVKGLLTNFHQPKSTLLLLVSALLGENCWKTVYEYALQYNFRFLSYGDCCLLLP